MNTYLFSIITVLGIIISNQGYGGSGQIEIDMSIQINYHGEADVAHCDPKLKLEVGKNAKWGMGVGIKRPADNEAAWTIEANAIQCEVVPDAIEEVDRKQSNLTYLLKATGDVSASIANNMGPAELLQINISTTYKILVGFDRHGASLYKDQELRRKLFVPESGTAILPLMVAGVADNGQETIRSVLMIIKGRLTDNHKPERHGSVSLSADINGGTVILDGGEVGKVDGVNECVLNHIQCGWREIALRAANGDIMRRMVHVQPGRTTLVEIKSSRMERKKSLSDLVFIEQNPTKHEEYRRSKDNAVVVKIPAGEFLMGNRETERNPLEHQVFVSEYFIDKQPVTWGQYKMFARETGTPLPPNEPYWGVHDDHPAVFVTWDEARMYCQWVGGRLPTEAEREKAARGTDERKYPWGNKEPTPELGVFRRQWGGIATDPVGIRPKGASPYGLLDAGGNVWEWCADWYDEKYYEVSPYNNPKGPTTGRARVVRGGSWDSRPDVLSSSCRNFGYIGYREGDFGFRCVMDTDSH